MDFVDPVRLFFSNISIFYRPTRCTCLRLEDWALLFSDAVVCPVTCCNKNDPKINSFPIRLNSQLRALTQTLLIVKPS